MEGMLGTTLHLLSDMSLRPTIDSGRDSFARAIEPKEPSTVVCKTQVERTRGRLDGGEPCGISD
jgi:hypothetical protein